MEPRIWIYKNILARMRAKDVKKADKLIVQIESTKKACAKRYGVPAEKFIVETPQCSVKFTKTYEKQEKNSFFYPAGAYLFKNVDVLIEAARLLKAQGISNYEIILTLTGKESKVSAMWEQACRSEALPLRFVGHVNFEEIGDYYAGSVLLFPSFVESFGLEQAKEILNYKSEEKYLCLYGEVIRKIDPPRTETYDGEVISDGCGYDHEHLNFRERITVQPVSLFG
jgi:glycosyltransferase involved in cell wall biosynthesis